MTGRQGGYMAGRELRNSRGQSVGPHKAYVQARAQTHPPTRGKGRHGPRPTRITTYLPADRAGRGHPLQNLKSYRQEAH